MCSFDARSGRSIRPHPRAVPGDFTLFFALLASLNYSRLMRLQSSSSTCKAAITCPKCRFEQEEGPECRRCRIVFSKFKPPVSAVEEPTFADTEAPSQPAPSGSLAQVFRLLSWISLPLTIGILLLILRQAPPLPIQTDPQAADRVAEKMAQLQTAVQSNQPHALSLNEAELNQWMRENLAIASTHQAQQADIPVPAGHEPTVQEVQSALKDVRMNLMGNQLRAYALFALYGKEISLQLEGTITTEGGYIRLRPTAGKLGSLPIPSSTLDSVVHQLFDSPNNRDKFQLPPQIESVRVENNSLVITTR